MLTDARVLESKELNRNTISNQVCLNYDGENSAAMHLDIQYPDLALQPAITAGIPRPNGNKLWVPFRV
jgi:hypothetical protein